MILVSTAGEGRTEPEISGDRIVMQCRVRSDTVTFAGRKVSPILWMVDD
jgi:hypothetical protein